MNEQDFRIIFESIQNNPNLLTKGENEDLNGIREGDIIFYSYGSVVFLTVIKDVTTNFLGKNRFKYQSAGLYLSGNIEIFDGGDIEIEAESFKSLNWHFYGLTLENNNPNACPNCHSSNVDWVYMALKCMDCYSILAG